MNETSISRWDLLTETFGRGHTLSYRWFRLREFFSTFSSYYESSVIPSIVVTCLACLQTYIPDFTGIPLMIQNLNFGSALAAFFIFLSVLSIEDICVAIKRHLNSQLSLIFLD
jgi:hypothetical protein